MKKLLNIIGWGLIISIIGFWFLKQTDVVKQTNAPKFTECFATNVLSYGKPAYYLDPEMQHLIGHPCYTTEQCKNWPPEGAPDVYCCVQIGECVRNV